MRRRQATGKATPGSLVNGGKPLQSSLLQPALAVAVRTEGKAAFGRFVPNAMGRADHAGGRGGGGLRRNAEAVHPGMGVRVIQERYGGRLGGLAVGLAAGALLTQLARRRMTGVAALENEAATSGSWLTTR